MADRSTVNRQNIWKRWHPDADPAELERQRVDGIIDQIVAASPAMTPAQIARISPIFRLVPEGEADQ